jgi:hypothetical protein
MKEKNRRNTIRFIRELNKRRESNKIATPLDLLRVLNKERRKRKIRDKLLDRLKGAFFC